MLLEILESLPQCIKVPLYLLIAAFGAYIVLKVLISLIIGNSHDSTDDSFVTREVGILVFPFAILFLIATLGRKKLNNVARKSGLPIPHDESDDF